MGNISKKDLEKLKYYIQERERLEREITKYSDSISDGYSSITYGEIRSHYSNSDAIYDLIIHNDKLKKQIIKRQKKLTVIIYKLMQIINKIKDPELKSIVELRSIYGKTWEQIGEEVHMDSSYARRKYIKFIEN